jgi:hypothetical protein
MCCAAPQNDEGQREEYRFHFKNNFQQSNGPE